MHTAVAAYLLAFIMLIQCVGSSYGWDADRSLQDEQLSNAKLNALQRLTSYRLHKRVPHNIEARALNQFKNCYFSPIQCVLMERRRR